MKRLLSITALALVIALSLAFTGCSGAQKDASANFQGSWKMTNVAGASEDDIALMYGGVRHERRTRPQRRQNCCS